MVVLNFEQQFVWSYITHLSVLSTKASEFQIQFGNNDQWKEPYTGCNVLSVCRFLQTVC